MDEKIVVKDSEIHAAGVFAAVPIKNGEVICVFKGEKMSISELMRRCENGEEKPGYPLQIGNEEYLDLDEPYVYINHSCSPNTGMRKEGELIALKDINPDEEITYDYSTTQWDTSDKWGEDYEEHWTMECECKCGSPKCRKLITEFDFLPVETKMKYIELEVLPDHIFNKLNE
jgi:SET domain-containing protein